MKDYPISVYQNRYYTSIVAKYLDNYTVKKNKTLHKTNFTSDMIFTKADASTSYEQVEKWTRQFNIYYIVCIESFFFVIYKSRFEFFSTSVRKVLSNLGKVHFGGSVHFFG